MRMRKETRKRKVKIMKSYQQIMLTKLMQLLLLVYSTSCECQMLMADFD